MLEDAKIREAQVMSEKIELNSAGQVLTSGSSSEWEEETTTNADVRNSQVTDNMTELKGTDKEVGEAAKKAKKRRKKRRIVERTPMPNNTSTLIKHPVDCSKWGCKCKTKHEKKVIEKVERRRPPTWERSVYIPPHSRQDLIKTEYPVLYRWDQQMRMKVKTGQVSKEEYLKQRVDKFADVLDDEAAERRQSKMKRFGSELAMQPSKAAPPAQRPYTNENAMRPAPKLDAIRKLTAAVQSQETIC